jgi:hypothetical protein
MNNTSFTPYIDIDGVQYSLKEVDGGWVTIARYVQLFKLKNVNVVNNWITRGVVPSQNVIEVPQLNNMKLIKVTPYSPRPYKR